MSQDKNEFIEIEPNQSTLEALTQWEKSESERYEELSGVKFPVPKEELLAFYIHWLRETNKQLANRITYLENELKERPNSRGWNCPHKLKDEIDVLTDKNQQLKENMLRISRDINRLAE